MYLLYCKFDFRLANDGANFSINTDDPGVVGKFLSDEYELVQSKMKLTWQQVVKSVSV